MPIERRIRLFTEGRNQALRIPPGIRTAGPEAIIRKDGNRSIGEPVAKPSLLSVLLLSNAGKLEPLEFPGEAGGFT